MFSIKGWVESLGNRTIIGRCCEIQKIMTLSNMTLSIMTLSIATLSISTLSIMTLSIMTLSIMTFSIMTLSIMTLSIMTLSILITHSIMCRYSECRGAGRTLVPSSQGRRFEATQPTPLSPGEREKVCLGKFILAKKSLWKIKTNYKLLLNFQNSAPSSRHKGCEIDENSFHKKCLLFDRKRDGES